MGRRCLEPSRPWCLRIDLAATGLLHLTPNLLRSNVDIMERNQIQLPEALRNRVKQTAEANEGSVTELVRRGIKANVQTFPAIAPKANWTMPLLRGSGGHLRDPAQMNAEADAVDARSSRRGVRR